MLSDIIYQLMGLKNLIRRNSENAKKGLQPDDDSLLRFPFILFSTTDTPENKVILLIYLLD